MQNPRPLRCRPSSGRHSSCRLLAVVADYLEVPSFSAFAALVRHPSVQNWLEIKGIARDCLDQLDTYYAEHLPYTLGEEWLGDQQGYLSIRHGG